MLPREATELYREIGMPQYVESAVEMFACLEPGAWSLRHAP